ncbi:sel1 repeat family protein [Salinicola endophyticus]|uniref:Sel1 repeat family protein n=1 Tax=Salinicola endophyticus TaxID=1949083 RepID=A0ABY8FKP3_9GAMM|nr:tetratricopeptide repeat protein [Salinicola endophyticus]WFF43378.1 sel1 repeat family protein [Salinicola endophyticus]
MKRLIFLIVFCLLSGAAQAKVLFHDPTGKELNTAFDSFSERQVKNLSPPDVGKKQYLLGLLYLNGDKEFHVEQNCQKAVELLTDAWGAGIADAGYALATMYYHGACTEKNVAKARELATQAAQDGYILAQRMLGMAYVGAKWEELYPYDIRKGIGWLSKAGNAGDRQAAAHLAGMYDSGEGVPKDEKKYFEWLKKAVFTKFEERNIAGFPALANCYENGKGTVVDLVKAYKYYDLSGTAGVEGKQRIAKEMTQEQIDEALRQSKEWQKEHNVQVGGGFIRRAN